MLRFAFKDALSITPFRRLPSPVLGQPDRRRLALAAGLAVFASVVPLGLSAAPALAAAGSISEFPVPTAASAPEGIAAGPDGNLWFTEEHGQKIGQITTSGSFSEFSLPTATSDAAEIAAGPDGNLWFTEFSG